MSVFMDDPLLFLATQTRRRWSWCGVDDADDDDDATLRDTGTPVCRIPALTDSGAPR